MYAAEAGDAASMVSAKTVLCYSLLSEQHKCVIEQRYFNDSDWCSASKFPTFGSGTTTDIGNGHSFVLFISRIMFVRPREFEKIIK